MTKLFGKNLLYLIIAFLVLLLVMNNIKINKYQEFANESIITSYNKIIGSAYMVSKELEEILKEKEVPKQDLEKVFIYNSQLIGELYYIQTSILTLNQTKVISFEKYDVVQDLRVKISKKNDQIIKLNEKDLRELNQLNEICLNIKEIINWDDSDILKNNLWINILKELNDRNLENLKK